MAFGKVSHSPTSPATAGGGIRHFPSRISPAPSPVQVRKIRFSQPAPGAKPPLGHRAGVGVVFQVRRKVETLCQSPSPASASRLGGRNDAGFAYRRTAAADAYGLSRSMICPICSICSRVFAVRGGERRFSNPSALVPADHRAFVPPMSNSNILPLGPPCSRENTGPGRHGRFRRLPAQPGTLYLNLLRLLRYLAGIKYYNCIRKCPRGAFFRWKRSLSVLLSGVIDSKEPL